MLPGEYPDINISSYFEGVKSFGEAECNLLDESQITLGYIGGDGGSTYTVPFSDDGSRTAIISCEPNTTYTITKEIATDRFVVGTTSEKPVHGMKVTGTS